MVHGEAETSYRNTNWYDFSTNVGQAVLSGVDTVFSTCEHIGSGREASPGGLGNSER